MFLGALVAASFGAFAQAAASCVVVCCLTVAASGTAAPFGFTTTFMSMPGWSVQTSL